MYLLIYNPVSGNSGDELSTIEGILNKYDVVYKTVVTYPKINLTEILQEESNDYTCIIAAGGDGTVSQVISAIVLNKLVADFIVYPRGTTNEYASNLDISKDTLERYLVEQTEVTSVDVGVYNSKNVFTYSFIFGNFSHVTYETPQWLKNKVGYIAYWIYGITTLYILKLKRYKMKFEFNDQVISGKFLFGSVSNSNTLGKVIHLNDVSYRDGLLELFLVKAPSSLREVLDFLKSARKGETSNNLILNEKIKSVKVSSPQKHSWSADGEYSGTFDELEIKVVDHAIKVVT